MHPDVRRLRRLFKALGPAGQGAWARKVYSEALWAGAGLRSIGARDALAAALREHGCTTETPYPAGTCGETIVLVTLPKEG